MNGTSQTPFPPTSTHYYSPHSRSRTPCTSWTPPTSRPDRRREHARPAPPIAGRTQENPRLPPGSRASPSFSAGSPRLPASRPKGRPGPRPTRLARSHQGGFPSHVTTGVGCGGRRRGLFSNSPIPTDQAAHHLILPNQSNLLSRTAFSLSKYFPKAAPIPTSSRSRRPPASPPPRFDRREAPCAPNSSWSCQDVPRRCCRGCLGGGARGKAHPAGE
jgi:hypothetical protein